MGIFTTINVPASFNRAARKERSSDELIGLCRGILADGHVNGAEARFLYEWIAQNRDVCGDPMARVLCQRLGDAIVDGVIDADEESDLLASIHSYVGGPSGDDSTHSASTWLPLCDPPPVPQFEGAHFAVTGTFRYGPRTLVASEIIARGGTIDGAVLKRTNYLIIADTASRDWKHSSYGRKIMNAVSLRDAGVKIAIIGEAHWANHL